MKYLITAIVLISLSAAPLRVFAGKHKHRGLPLTEIELMDDVLSCLRYKDSPSYYTLFPPFDTLWHMVLHNTDNSPETVQQLNALKEHPQSLINFDPYYNHDIINRFSAILRKGEDSGIHWNTIVMQRYELQKQTPTKNLIGFDKIAPERFSGYIFIRDLLGRSTFCISISEIQKINGYFFGGQVINILEASTIDEFKNRENEERKYFFRLAEDAKNDTGRSDTSVVKDTATLIISEHPQTANNNLAVIDTTDDDKPKTRKEVVDRKYYEGRFDDEIPVKLFIRYMKDPRSDKVGFWDGLYKFGDQANYVKLNIAKNAEGIWIMEDEPPVGIMELELKNKIYTGSWTNNGNQTGYDVVLTQTDILPKKLEELDNILEKGLSGSASQKNYPQDSKQKKTQADSYDPND